MSPSIILPASEHWGAKIHLRSFKATEAQSGDYCSTELARVCNACTMLGYSPMKEN